MFLTCVLDVVYSDGIWCTIGLVGMECICVLQVENICMPLYNFGVIMWYRKCIRVTCLNL